MVNQRNVYEKIDRKAEVMDTPYDRWIASQGIDIEQNAQGVFDKMRKK